MRKLQLSALGILLVCFATTALISPSAQSQPPTDAPTALAGALSARTKVDAKQVDLVLKALGPAIQEELAEGRQVVLPGLGRFRVVRIPAHRDLVDGRPATIPAYNYVEFLPNGEVVQAANSPDAAPAVTVPAFQYNPLPDRVPSLRVPFRRMPNIRTP